MLLSADAVIADYRAKAQVWQRDADQHRINGEVIREASSRKVASVLEEMARQTERNVTEWEKAFA